MYRTELADSIILKDISLKSHFIMHPKRTYLPLGSGTVHLDCELELPVAGVAASCLPVGITCVATRFEICGVVGFEGMRSEPGSSGVIGLGTTCWLSMITGAGLASTCCITWTGGGGDTSLL